MLKYNETNNKTRNDLFLSFLKLKGIKTLDQYKNGETLRLHKAIKVRSIKEALHRNLSAGDIITIEKIDVKQNILFINSHEYINYNEVYFPSLNAIDIRYAHIDRNSNIYHFHNQWYRNGKYFNDNIPETVPVGLINTELYNNKVKIKKLKIDSDFNFLLFEQKRNGIFKYIDKSGSLQFFNGKLINDEDSIYITDEGHNSVYTIPFDEIYEIIIAKKLFKKNDNVKMIRYDKGTGLIYGNVYKTVTTIKNSGSMLIVVTDGSKNYTSNIKNFRLHEKKTS